MEVDAWLRGLARGRERPGLNTVYAHQENIVYANRENIAHANQENITYALQELTRLVWRDRTGGEDTRLPYHLGKTAWAQSRGRLVA